MAEPQMMDFFATNTKFNIVGLKFKLPIKASLEDIYAKLEGWGQSGVKPPLRLFALDLLVLPRLGVRVDTIWDPAVPARILIKQDFNLESIKKTYGNHSILNYFKDPNNATLLQELLLENDIESLVAFQNAQKVEDPDGYKGYKWCEIAGLSSAFIFGAHVHQYGMNLLVLALGLGQPDLARRFLQALSGTITLFPYGHEDKMKVDFAVLGKLLDVGNQYEMDWILRVAMRQSKHAEATLAFIRDNFNKNYAGICSLGQYVWNRTLQHAFEAAFGDTLPRLITLLQEHFNFDANACMLFMSSQNAPTLDPPGQFNTLAVLLERFGPVFKSTLDKAKSQKLFLEVAKNCNNVRAMEMMIKTFPDQIAAATSADTDPLLLALTWKKKANEAMRFEFAKLLLNAGARPNEIYGDDESITAFEIGLYRRDFRMIELMLSHGAFFWVRDEEDFAECRVGDVHIVEILLAKYPHLLGFLNVPPPEDDDDLRLSKLCTSLLSFARLCKLDPRWKRSIGQWKEQDNAAWNLLTRKGLALLNAVVAIWKAIKAQTADIPADLAGRIPSTVTEAYLTYISLLFKKSKWDTALTETLPYINDPDRAELLSPRSAPITVALLCCHRLQNIKGCKKYASMLEFGPDPNFPPDPSALEVWKQYFQSNPQPTAAASAKGAAAKKSAKKTAPAAPAAALAKSPAAASSQSSSPAVSPCSSSSSSSSAAAAAAAKEAALENQPFNAAPKPTSPAPTPSSPNTSTSPSTAAAQQRSKVKLPECPVCMEHLSDHALAPCGHTFCGDCARALQTCGQCRAPIVAVVKLFFA